MDATSGLTGTEIKTHIKNFVGNQSSSFDDLLTVLIPLGEYRYCKLHDWSFLHVTNCSLTVTSGTSEYTLDDSAIGYEMQATNVKNIFSQANGIYLGKSTLEKIRRRDPEIDDGTSSSYITHWAPIGDKKIIVYPGSAFGDTTLKIDGKIEPTSLLTLGNYPTVPFRYQESFIQYLIALALDRENDDRARRMMEQTMLLIRQDIADDMSHQGDTVEPRIKGLAEAGKDGNWDEFDALNMWSE